MKSNRNTLLNVVACIALSMTLFLQGSMNVFAVTTEFDVPDIEKEWTPDNCIYKSPNLNIQVCKWGYGLVADVLNTSDIDTLLAELHANVSTAGNKRSILGIYMEGAGLSEANAADITNAGWTEVDLYYNTFFVGGSAPTGAMTPSVAKTTDENAMTILAEAGITENIAMVNVSDVKMTWANYILYETEFSFLKGKQLHSYKFINDLGVFVPIEETYFGSYSANFLELYDLQKAEADVNGIYVTLTQSLPDSIVVSADQIVILRETASVTPPTVDSSANSSQNEGAVIPTDPEISQETQQSESEGPVKEQENDAEKQESNTKEQESNAEEKGSGNQEAESQSVIESNTVKWNFPNGQAPASFTADAVVKLISETEVSVDFAYSGPLPEGTEVTVNISKDNVSYQEGDTLYLYYCNPETSQRDFVSAGKYQDSQVTFKIYHCSEYVITNMGPNVSDVADITEGAEGTDKKIPGWIILVLFGMIACGVAGVVIFKRRK